MLQLINIFQENVIDVINSLIKDGTEAARVWQTAPGYSTIRLNTLTGETTRDVIVKIKQLLQQQYESKERSMPLMFIHPALKDVLVIEHNKVNEELELLPQSIVVDAACGAAVLRGAHVYARGILGAPAGLLCGDSVSVLADVEGACKQGLMVPYMGTSCHVANGVTTVSRKELFCGEKMPSGIGVQITSCRGGDGPSLNEIHPSCGFPQNLPSIVAGHVLAPEPGERVLDMCAAPGGKTTHIAALMKNQGTIVALDKTTGKVERIVENCTLQGITCVSAFPFDATKACSEDLKDLSDLGPPFPPESFDRVLLDAPCSALGNRPCLRNPISVKQLQSYPRVQRKLLKVAERLVRPGGTLVYSTCTICPEENELAVAWALHNLPTLQLVKQEPHIGGVGRPHGSLTTAQADLTQRWFPFDGHSSDYDQDCIGFFIAKFVKLKNNT